MMVESLWIQIHLVEKDGIDQEDSVHPMYSSRHQSTVERMSSFPLCFMPCQRVEDIQTDIQERVMKILCRKAIDFYTDSIKIEIFDDFSSDMLTSLAKEDFFGLLRKHHMGTHESPIEVTVCRKQRKPDITSQWTAMPPTYDWTSYSVLDEPSLFSPRANSYVKPPYGDYRRPIWMRQERIIAGSKNSLYRFIRSLSSSYIEPFPFEYEGNDGTKPTLLTLLEEEGPHGNYIPYKQIFIRTCFPVLYDRIVYILFDESNLTSQKRMYLAGGYGVGQSTFIKYLIYRLFQDLQAPMNIVWDQGGSRITLIDHQKKVWMARRTSGAFDKELSSPNTFYIYDPPTTFNNPRDVECPLHRSGPLTSIQAKQLIVSGPFTFYLDPPVKKQQAVILPPWKWEELRGCRATCGAAERVCKDTLETLHYYWGGSIKYVLSSSNEEEAIEKVKAIVKKNPLHFRFKPRSLSSPVDPRDLVFQLNAKGVLSICSKYVKSKVYVTK